MATKSFLETGVEIAAKCKTETFFKKLKQCRDDSVKRILFHISVLLYWLRNYVLYNTNLFLCFHYNSLITTTSPHSTDSILEISSSFMIYFLIIPSSTFLSLPFKFYNKSLKWFFVCPMTSVSFFHLILIYLITVTSCKYIDSIFFSPGFPAYIKPFLLKYFSPNFLLEHSLYLFFP